ncbi:MAG: ABC transporter ATP-binding protein [Micromonosporaceae bacterium]
MGRHRSRTDLHPDVVIGLQGVTVTRSGSHLLRSVDWQVELDERWVVLGPNGAGKTTLLNIAAARMHPTKGKAHLLGERLGRTAVAELRTRIGLSSMAMADRIPAEETVQNVVVTSAWDVVGRFREAYDAVDEVRARVLLEQLGVVHLADRTYGTLSEGERKRVQIARALMSDPELLLLDEPAAGLDLGGREALMQRLTELAYDPDAPAMALVAHHVEEIPPGFSHALLLREGSVVAQGLAYETITSENLSKTFGMPLALERHGDRYYARAG